MNHQLTLSEAEEIQYFLKSYPNINGRLDSILATIGDLMSEKDMLLENLQDLRDQESLLHEMLENKYGEGEIDTKTWSYKTK